MSVARELMGRQPLEAVLAHRGPHTLFLSVRVPVSREVLFLPLGQGGGGGHLGSKLDTVTAVGGGGGRLQTGAEVLCGGEASV